ncbi:Uu.00g082230.m01.CDS01 [Anthostomella pinea]|uniref:glucan endo-1,6-beta-glucosidase n=1 Tax=Anthostomella pinea TaxID=933095 RepID=A0AAI8YJI2_9PEZI|nr:Uu.00g082230.m01.CDS01 [Anthostomella pinea]
MRGSLTLIASLAALSSVTQAWLPSQVSRTVTGRRGLTVVEPYSPARRWMLSSKIRGVNLGCLFIIEKWLCPDEWNTIGCSDQNDEFNCVAKLGQEQANSKFQNHWGSWITEDDFDKMNSLNLNAVRIPIGFWMDEGLVGSDEHYPQGGEKYLLDICEMASSHGMYIMLEMHAAPGVQTSDQQFTGHVTTDVEFFNDNNYQRGVDFLTYLTKLVANNNQTRNVGMIGVLNEPERGNSHPDLTSDFYPKAYSAIREAEGNRSDKLHIAFMGTNWGSGDPKQYLPPGYESVAFESHRYQRWDSSVQVKKAAYINDACTNDQTADGETPTLVTEWCIEPPDNVWDPDANEEFYKKWFAAQVIGFEKYAAGWMFWNWKSDLDDWRWDYSKAADALIIPSDLDNMTTNSGACSTGSGSTYGHWP